MSADRDTLFEALRPLRARLAPGKTEPPRREDATDVRGSSLAHAVDVFQLEPFERDVILLAAGCELDPEFAALVAHALGDPDARLPTLGLALAVLERATWDVLVPEAPLRHYALIELVPGGSLTRSSYRVAERVLHALLGVATIDAALRPLVTRIEESGVLAPAHETAAAELSAHWSTQAPWPVLVCTGDDIEAKPAIAAEIALRCGCRAWEFDATLLPEPAAERETLARLWEREAALGGAVLTVTGLEELDPARQRSALRWIERLHAATIVCTRERVPIVRRPTVVAEIARPNAPERRMLWERALGPRGAALNGSLDRIVGQFRLGADAIARIGARVDGSSNEIWEAARGEARPQLDDLALRMPCAVSWDDLVLPPDRLEALREIAAHVRRRGRVYDDWGFGRGGRGLGVSALFTGPSGVGKTLAAEVLAAELQLDCYRIDLSAVVSKYIGETEKSLRRVFDAAEGGGAVLLFDEADALFGKRTDVNDSHDRYANIEVSYLLQRMEAYRGLAILTTNFKSAIDSAFLRRLRYVVSFPFPSETQRLAIWRGVFPPQTPTDGLKTERLAQLNVTGASIRNIALHASFLAADEDGMVTMTHVRRAARTEYAKLEQPLTDTELAGWR
jgi:hypothetical protein